MGRQEEPSQAELEFIFERLKQGKTPSEIAYQMADTDFPIRRPEFISRKRKYYDAAKRVLQTDNELYEDPVISKRKGEHFQQLSDIARLIIEEFATVRENPSQTDASDKFVLKIIHQWDNYSPDEWPIEQQILSVTELNERFLDTLKTRIGRYFGHASFEYLVSHLEAEYPLMKSKNIYELAKENSFELIELITLLSRRKTFRGTCEICKPWYKE